MRDETGGTILHVRPKRLSVVNNVCLSVVKKRRKTETVVPTEKLETRWATYIKLEKTGIVAGYWTKGTSRAE